MNRKGLILTFLLMVFCFFAEAQSESVIFSCSGGFYERSFALSLDCHSPLHHVRYTINGNNPTSSSPRYEQPLQLDASRYSTSDIYTIPTSPVYGDYVPDSVRHAIVIRAAVFDDDGNRVSKVATNTYLIHELGFDSHGLAVVSICADSLDLYDYETGIFVPGVNFDIDNPENTGNYFQRGREWERLVNVEFYFPEGRGIVNQQCGLRTHGNRARKVNPKGMKIYAREEYGMKRFYCRFFDTTPIDSFKHLILKPLSTYWPEVGIQDYVANRMAMQLDVEAANTRPVLLYLNGEYWGIYFLQEKLDDSYLEDHYGVDLDQCTIISNWGNEVESGDGTRFEQLMDWLEEADLSDAQNYDYLCSLVDVDNFIDYQILETFIANTDWPANNMRCWQANDGKWRWAFFDGDAALLDKGYDVFENANYIKNDKWHTGARSTLLFRRLMENNAFKERFRQRVEVLCYSVFQYDVLESYVDEVSNDIAPEVPNHIDRFGYPESMYYWHWGVSLVKDFLWDRVEAYLAAYYAYEPFKPHDYQSNTNDFVCYPNPVEEEVKIMMLDGRSRVVDYTLCDVSGRSYMNGWAYIPACEPIVLPVDLRPGVYVLKIGGEAHRIVKF